MDRTIKISKELAKKQYSSNNKELNDLALQAYTEKELTSYTFKEITTFSKALDAYKSYYDPHRTGIFNFVCVKNTIENIEQWSKASAAKVKLDIIRKALNAKYNMHLTKNADDMGYTWYPNLRFTLKGSSFYEDALKSNVYKKIGEIASENFTYDVLGGFAIFGEYDGLGNYSSYHGVGTASPAIGFLGCATEEIAKHFGRYFGMLIIEAMYGDLKDFKIITSL